MRIVPDVRSAHVVEPAADANQAIMKHEIPDPGFALFQAATKEALDRLSRKLAVDTHVHAARKAIKQARAALRLMKPGLQPGVFDRENRTLRDAAACLSPFRDAKARFVATALVEGKHVDVETMQAGLMALRQVLKARLIQARKTLASTDVSKQSARLIEQSRERLSAAPHSGDRKASIRALKKIYGKARRTFAVTKAATTPANLHEWRKQCKYLQMAATALRDAGIHRLSRAIARTHDIADWLGDDHDLVALAGAIRRTRMNGNQSSVLLEAIVNLRKDLERKALDCGEQLLRKSPKRFAARLV